MNIWTRLGISVALLGIFCIVCSEMIQRDGYYDLHRREIAVALCGAGAVAFVIGRVLNRRRRLEHQPKGTSEEQEDESNPETAGQPFILFNLAYWGPILGAFGLVVLFIPANTSRVVAVEARAPAIPKPKPKPALPAPQTNAVKLVAKQTNHVEFPLLKLQGVTQRGARSSALVNGKTLFLGDTAGEARLISIFESSVVFELKGEMLSVTLPK